MATFELDLGFEPDQVAAGVEQLCRQRGLWWSRRDGSPRGCEFTITLPGDVEALVSVRPLPAERLNYASFFPRTLLEGRAEDDVQLEALRRDITLRFLRVMG